METCDRCKHWDGPGSYRPQGECLMAFSLETCYEVIDDNLAATYPCTTNDGDSDPQPLLTGPKYGCIHWEAK